MDEARLVRRLQKRDRGALEAAVGRYTPYVSAVVSRTLGAALPREDMEEAVSDTFLALWRHVEGFDPARGAFLPWLGAIARNRALNKLRGREGLVSLDDMELAAPDRLEEQVVDRDAAQALWAAVEGLGPPDDQLFLRYYYHGEKLGDIARALGMNGQTAKTRLARGRKKLKEILTRGGYADEEQDAGTVGRAGAAGRGL